MTQDRAQQGQAQVCGESTLDRNRCLAVIERLRAPVWVHGGTFESPQLCKDAARADMSAAANTIASLLAERDAAIALLQRTFQNAKLPPKLEGDISAFLTAALPRQSGETEV